ncbi:MAG: type II toxin-antitoxin system Phd/YefM family antitoxin [Sandaracinaceae bacterium]|nr:type II toxin-antitoxin system Phd/YefM family antitoxin [Sandaracinaceae bacterium]
MTSVTIRDLRTRFPAVRDAVDRDGEVVVTEHGRPVMLLRAYVPTDVQPPEVDDYARLRARMPRKLSARARRALDEADRGER